MSRIYLNEEWKFTENYEATLCEEHYPIEQLIDVRLPHTCKELPYHYFDENDYQMLSGYRRVLFAPLEWQGKCILFTCEGVAHDTEVYVNSQLVKKHSCGYTGFTTDISQYLKFGQDNIIVLKVDSRESLNVPPFGFVIDYMTFGGVYRDVYLEVKEPAYIVNVFVRGEITNNSTKGYINCDIDVSDVVLASQMQQDGTWYVRGYMTRVGTDACPFVKDEDWNVEKKLFTEELVLKEHTTANFIHEVSNIHYWDTEHPYLYQLKLELLCENKIYDTYDIRFGFREVEFRKDGFYLNNKKLKIRGLNRHQSYPYVGYAMPESMQKFDADILKKELGCNAVRTSHYPQSHYFVDRCDELGLLVFMEIPGWQHIGDGAWKAQACQNVRDMVVQYRNHPSIMIWGVRINESGDDDYFYTETNRIAHELDDTRQTGGVRNFKNSHLLEDVYTYNEFVHDGIKPGCEPKKDVTSDVEKPYLITEYNGHMYPTKSFDWEEHRLEHAMRHARVLDAVALQEDIAGSFGWCMFDYNTHKDFGSGDRICYHGVMDMFRNPKLAASVYACQQTKDTILEISSSMDIGEHPATNLGKVYIFTNADSVRMYKNNCLIKEYIPSESEFKGLPFGPILVDDLVGDLLEKQEGFPKKKAKFLTKALNYVAVHGYQKFPPHLIWKAIRAMVQYHMTPGDLISLYTKYIGNWGETATVYRFDAVKDGNVVKTVTRQPMRKLHLKTLISHTTLVEKNSYDMAAIRFHVVDDNGNVAPYFQEPVKIVVEGPLQIVGPDVVSAKAGMGGLYVKTINRKGVAKVILTNTQLETAELTFEIM